MIPPRIVIVGGPRHGKSTLARRLRGQGLPTFCTDPLSLVKEPEAEVTYLPEGLDWSAGSAHVASRWFSAPGPWCVEGVATARALRKWPGPGDPCDAIIVLPMARTMQIPGQRAMSIGVATVWASISDRFRHLVIEERDLA